MPVSRYPTFCSHQFDADAAHLAAPRAKMNILFVLLVFSFSLVRVVVWCDGHEGAGGHISGYAHEAAIGGTIK